MIVANRASATRECRARLFSVFTGGHGGGDGASGALNNGALNNGAEGSG